MGPGREFDDFSLRIDSSIGGTTGCSSIRVASIEENKTAIER